MNQIQLKCLVHSNGCRCLRCLQRAHCACICVLMRDVLLHVRKTQPIALQTKQHTATEPSHYDVIFRFFVCCYAYLYLSLSEYIHVEYSTFNIRCMEYNRNIQRPFNCIWNCLSTYNNNDCDHRSVLGCCYVYAFHVNLFPHFELCILTAVYMIFRTTIMRTQILRKATTTKVHTECLSMEPFC